MKRLIALMALAALLIIPSLCLAVAQNDDTCVPSITQMPESGNPAGEIKKYLLLSCTADSGDASLSYTLADSTGFKVADIDGYHAFKVDVKNGDTPMKADSDLGMVDGFGIVLLTATGTGNGLNLVNSSAGKNEEYMEGPNGDDYQILYKNYPPVFTVTNNDVVSGQVLIRIPLVWK